MPTEGSQRAMSGCSPHGSVDSRSGNQAVDHSTAMMNARIPSVHAMCSGHAILILWTFTIRRSLNKHPHIHIYSPSFFPAISMDESPNVPSLGSTVGPRAFHQGAIHGIRRSPWSGHCKWLQLPLDMAPPTVGGFGWLRSVGGWSRLVKVGWMFIRLLGDGELLDGWLVDAY